MNNRVMIILSPAAFFVITIVAGVLIVANMGTGEATGTEVLIKGQLLTENCVEKGIFSACYLESAANGRVVLFTGDRKLYGIELERAPQWKLDSAFGKQVVVKGVVKGNKIRVNDVVGLAGKKKLSKACL